MHTSTHTPVPRSPLLTGLGQALRWLRERQARKQYRVAADAGITKGMLSAYETGRQRPSLDTLDKLLETLRSDLNDLHNALQIVNGRPDQMKGWRAFEDTLPADRTGWPAVRPTPGGPMTRGGPVSTGGPVSLGGAGGPSAQGGPGAAASGGREGGRDQGYPGHQGAVAGGRGAARAGGFVPRGSPLPGRPFSAFQDRYVDEVREGGPPGREGPPGGGFADQADRSGGSSGAGTWGQAARRSSGAAGGEPPDGGPGLGEPLMSERVAGELYSVLGCDQAGPPLAPAEEAALGQMLEGFHNLLRFWHRALAAAAGLSGPAAPAGGPLTAPGDLPARVPAGRPAAPASGADLGPAQNHADELNDADNRNDADDRKDKDDHNDQGGQGAEDAQDAQHAQHDENDEHHEHDAHDEKPAKEGKAGRGKRKG